MQEQRTSIPWGLYTIGGLGGLLFGYDTGIISGAGPIIQGDWKLNAAQLGFITASVLIGSMVGALAIGGLADRFGRKKLFIIAALLFIAGGFFCMFSQNFAEMSIARIVLGFAIGAASSLTPTYLVELADKDHRGSVASMFQLMITIGILVAYFANLLFLNHNIGGLADWRWMLGSELLPAAALMVGSIALPESPRYLIKVGKVDLARKILEKRLKRDGSEEIAEIQAVLAKSQGKGTFRELFSVSGKSVLVAVLLMFFQQLVGINAVIYFVPKIFQSAFHFSSANSIWISVGIGTVNVISTIVALGIMNRFNRKSLLIFGSVEMAVSFIILIILTLTLGVHSMGSAIATMIFIAFFIIGFAVSWGPICWIMISEIFPLKVRGLGTSIGSAANWIGDFIVSQFFTILLVAFHNNIAGPFAIFCAFAVLSIVFVRYMVPETRGKSLEEIEEKLDEKKA
ncbi:MAG: sugar porter family MFS transporter [Aeriscardovia sp.]|nr:sugar porter family MFS transporter [Aeriscardovia sp.]